MKYDNKICIKVRIKRCVEKAPCKHEFSDIIKKMKAQIDEMYIKCKYAPFGCMKISKLGKIQHHEEECIFSECVCNNPACFEEEVKKGAIMHIANCPFSLMICDKGCKKNMKLFEV